MILFSPAVMINNVESRSRIRTFICLTRFRGVGYHRRNPQGRIYSEMYVCLCRVQRLARPAVRAQGCRGRYRARRTCLLHERHPGHLPEHRLQSPGLQYCVRCRCGLCLGHEQRVPGRRQEDERDRLCRGWRDTRYRHPGDVRCIRTGDRFPLHLLR